MDDKKKIVLGSEDILQKGVSDIFLNISLQQTFNQIKKEKYDNDFDLAEQFRKERNASRNFRIYGIVDSTIIHTDNMSIQVFKNSGLTQFLGTLHTTPLVYNEENVYGKRRGKYLLEIDNYDTDVVYFRILGDNVTYGNQVFEQRLVFYTLDGDFVEYGTETVDIGLNNPGFLEIENNFPFFYNKHWIKKDIQVIEEKPTIMQFGSESSTVLEDESITFDIVMDKPSPFGNESVVLDAVLGTILPADFELKISGSPITFPITLNWSPGEQNKTITFDALEDDVYEFSENMMFELKNFQFTNSGLTTNHFVNIDDATPRKITKYHLGEIYKNRIQFTGRTAQFTPSSPEAQYTAYSILRNGLHFGNTNEEFYPGDTYQLAVKNAGIDTILPINEDFGVNTEQLWPAGIIKYFNLDTNYSGNEKHKVKMIFPQGAPFNFGKIRINGADMNITQLTFSQVSNRIVDGSANDWLPFFGLEKDWTAVSEGSSAITITSKTTGLPVKIDIIPVASSSGFIPGPPNPAANPYLVELSPYVERNQIPKVLSLYANMPGNNFTNYEFNFIKPGYNGIFVSAQTQAASASGVNRYLVTSFKYVSRNWNDTLDDCIYSSAATLSIGYPVTQLSNGAPYPGNYLHPVGEAHINGSVLLTANNLPGSKLNLTAIKTAAFKTYPLIVEPCTDEDLLVDSISQITRVLFPPIGQSTPSIRNFYSNNASGFRSFNFRTGTTGPYTTFYKDNSGFFSGPSDIRWNSNIFTSGATTVSGWLSQIIDYGNIMPPIPLGPLSGFNSTGTHLPSTSSAIEIYLESKTPGIPFEITNIVNAVVTDSASFGMFGPTIVAGQILGPIEVEEIRENGVAGVDLNIAKNWMNGYNVDLQIGPSALGGSSGGTTSPPALTTPPALFAPSL
ncbi:MAG: hypothetical protein AABY15_04235 [Nanoarchaeota archaeon]